MKIADVVLSQDTTRINKIVLVKDCITYDLELGHSSSVIFDGEIIG
jgi:hypothetical protein